MLRVVHCALGHVRPILLRVGQLLPVVSWLFPVFVSLLLLSPAKAVDIQYVYDELGRLVQIIDAAGASAQYVYDKAGNIVEIRRVSTGTVSIAEFTPDSGPVGTQVTIYGTGFDPTPSANTVQFGGIAATVTSASATKIETSVPSGATTGPISVANSAGTAASLTNFTVIAGTALGAPTITSFTPTSGAAGTSVTISGTNFDTASGATKVYFNQSIAAISAITSTSITATVPANTGSGPIQVRTPAGVATSADDFLIPTGLNNPADVIARARAIVGGPAQTLNISTQNKLGLLLFSGTAGAALTVDLPSFTATPSGAMISYEVHSPRNVRIDTGTVAAGNRSIHLPILPANGTYSVYFRPTSQTVSLSARVVVDGAVALNGNSIAISTTFAGQSVRTVFANAGHNVGMSLSSLVHTPSGGSTSLYAFGPNSESLGTAVTCNPTSPGGACELDVLSQVTGTYSVVAKPPTSSTMAGTLTVSSDVTSTLASGTPFSLNLSRAGQNGRLSFSGTAGQSATIDVRSLVTSPSNQIVTVQILRPDGTLLRTASGTTNSDGVLIHYSSLPTTGIYTLFVDPAYGATAQMTITLDPPMDIAVDGSAVSVSAGGTNQVRRLTFAGTAGQKLGAGLSGLTQTSAGAATLSINNPDGNSIVSNNSCSPSNPGGRCELDVSLTVTGPHSIVLTPPASAAVTAGTLTLSSDQAGTLVIGDPPVSASINRSGENLRYTFSATAGQLLRLNVTSLSTSPASQSVSFLILRPDGTTLNSISSTGPAVSLDIATIPTTGTYSVFVDPNYAATATMNLSISTR